MQQVYSAANSDSWVIFYVSYLQGLLPKEKLVVGEKTISNIKYIELLENEIDNLKVVFMVRDGRACLTSRRASKLGSLNLQSICDDWNLCMEVINKRVDNSQCCIVRYEDLVSNPEFELNRVCSFLEIDYEEAMLQYSERKESGYLSVQAHHSNTQKKVFTSTVSQWKEKLSHRQIALAEDIMSSNLKNWGYSLTTDPFTAPNWYRRYTSSMRGVDHMLSKVRQIRKAVKSRIIS